MNDQYRFLIVAPVKEQTTERIISDIQRNKLYQVALVPNVLTARTYLATGAYNCLVFDVDTLSNNAVVSIADLREMGFLVPVMVFSGNVSKDDLEKVKKMARVTLIEKPFESKDVWGICEKILHGRPVHQRVFRRFNTAQKAAIEKTLTGETFAAEILNLSRGGAFVELSQGHFMPGELLRLSVRGQNKRKFDIDAEVVWSKVVGQESGKSNAGLRFMSSEDVYRNLLSRI